MKKILFTLAALLSLGFAAQADNLYPGQYMNDGPTILYGDANGEAITEIALNPGESVELSFILAQMNCTMISGFGVQWRMFDVNHNPINYAADAMVQCAKVYGSRTKFWFNPVGIGTNDPNQGGYNGVSLANSTPYDNIYRILATNTVENMIFFAEDEDGNPTCPAVFGKYTIKVAEDWAEEFATLELDQEYSLFNQCPDYDAGVYWEAMCADPQVLTIKNAAFVPPTPDPIPLTGDIVIGDCDEDGYVTIEYTGEEEGLTIVAMIDGVPVEITDGKIFMGAYGTATVTVEVSGEGYITKTAEKEVTWEEPVTPEPTEAPVITYETFDDCVVITATGAGTVTMYVNNELVDNPYTIMRGEEATSVNVTAYAQEEGKEISAAATLEVPVPALEPAAPVDLTGEIVVTGPDADGVVNVAYTGEEEGVEITVEGYEVDEDGNIQLPDYGTYTLVVTVGGEGYNDLTEEFDVTWTEPTPPEPEKTPMPEITYEVNDDAVIITATGEGEVLLYVNGEPVENPCTLTRGAEDVVVVVTATAQADDMLISDEASMEITIPAVEEPIVMEGIYIVLVDQYGTEHMIELSEGTDGSYITTVTLEYDPWGSFYWDPNLTEEENNANRPDVPFYFLIDGVRYGAEEAMVDTYLGNAMNNPLTNEVEDGFYSVPVGFAYTLGVAVVGENEYYVYAAVSKKTGVDEMNADKTVAGVRYFNMAGQEMQEVNGATIVVTTYTDGTISAVKVMK